MLVSPARPAFGPSATSSPPAMPQTSAASVSSRRVVAEHAADECGKAGSDRRQQHALHAQPVRARLIEEHRVECAGRDAEADGDVIGRNADAERDDDRGGVAQRDAQSVRRAVSAQAECGACGSRCGFAGAVQHFRRLG